MRILQPPGWAPPKGYANGVAARGTFVAIGGQIGWNADQRFESDDFVAQARGRPEHIVRMTWYVVDRDEYARAQRGLGAAYREVIGRHYPAMTAVEVGALMEARAKVEIEATAIVPDAP